MPNLKNFYRFFKHNSKGFSLIEVIIALALMGIIGIAFAGGLFTTSKAIIIDDERATAESLARSQIEYVKSSNYSVIGAYDKINIDPDEFPNYDIDLPLTVDQLENGLQKITVTVTHHDEPVITLEGYKANR